MLPREPALNEYLKVRDIGDAYVVTRANKPSDWLMSFDKDGGLEAKEWAERVVSLHNELVRSYSRSARTERR